MINRRQLTLLVLSCSVPSLSRASSGKWNLITPEEAAEINRRLDSEPAPLGANNPTPATDQLAPILTVKSPDLTKHIYPPVSFDIRFTPSPGAKIVPATFKAVLSVLDWDLTDRILANATINESGITAEKAIVPAGKWVIQLSIADNKSRVGKRNISMLVVG